MERKKTMTTFHAYYLGIAIAVRKKANCTGNRVGAVLVKGNRVVSTGYNGTPQGMKNCLDGGCLRCRLGCGAFPPGTGYDLCICVHAEQNALLSAARFGIAVEGATLYTTMQPCFGCLKELLQAGVVAVYYLHDWAPHDDDPGLLRMKKAEYRKIKRGIGIFRRFPMSDPEEGWAVTKKRVRDGKA